MSLFMNTELKRGIHITVYDAKQTELGEGTLIVVTDFADMGMTAYECEEHTILARGKHWLKVNGKMELKNGPSAGNSPHND